MCFAVASGISWSTDAYVSALSIFRACTSKVARKARAHTRLVTRFTAETACRLVLAAPEVVIVHEIGLAVDVVSHSTGTLQELRATSAPLVDTVVRQGARLDTYVSRVRAIPFNRWCGRSWQAGSSRLVFNALETRRRSRNARFDSVVPNKVCVTETIVRDDSDARNVVRTSTAPLIVPLWWAVLAVVDTAHTSVDARSFWYLRIDVRNECEHKRRYHRARR